jgi:hypothetical protein
LLREESFNALDEQQKTPRKSSEACMKRFHFQITIPSLHDATSLALIDKVNNLQLHHEDELKIN